MAYAGTPTGLAQKAGTSQPWKSLLAAVTVLAIGFALVIAVMFVGSRAAAPATDRGFDQIEAQRGAAALSATTSNAVEKAAAAKGRAMSGVPAAVEKPYQVDERPRGAVDNSYNLVENARGAALRTGSALDATTLDRIYQEIQSSRGAHGPLP